MQEKFPHPLGETESHRLVPLNQPITVVLVQICFTLIFNV